MPIDNVTEVQKQAIAKAARKGIEKCGERFDTPFAGRGMRILDLTATSFRVIVGNKTYEVSITERHS